MYPMEEQNKRKIKLYLDALRGNFRAIVSLRPRFIHKCVVQEGKHFACYTKSITQPLSYANAKCKRKFSLIYFSWLLKNLGGNPSISWFIVAVVKSLLLLMIVAGWWLNGFSDFHPFSFCYWDQNRSGKCSIFPFPCPTTSTQIDSHLQLDSNRVCWHICLIQLPLTCHGLRKAKKATEKKSISPTGKSKHQLNYQ
jgi:hypothetical protein